MAGKWMECVGVLFLLCFVVCGGVQRAESQASEAAAEYQFTLLFPEDTSENCVLRITDSAGNTLQQLSCGALKEPVEVFSDNLAEGYGNDLEIFQEGSRTGLLFVYLDGEGYFSEDSIEIPGYDEAKNGRLIRREESEELLEETIYQINEPKKRVEKQRSFHLDKSGYSLRIWDYLENRPVFEGNVSPDAEGGLKNRKYYEYLFWNNLFDIGEYQAESTIDTWVSGEEQEALKDSEDASGFERIQDKVFGNTGSCEQFESRQALLEAFGFADSTPMYRYFDQFGNLQLELYLDKKTDKGCGIHYSYYRYTGELEKLATLRGFTISGVSEEEWEEPDIYSLKSVDGTDGSDDVSDYREEVEYKEDGRPAHYLSTGEIDWLKDEPAVYKLLDIDFIYRDDGSLFCRSYSHSGQVFGTAFCYLYSRYDEKERPIYERAYITHGDLEYYYIYQEGRKRPVYTLLLDNNLNYAIPALVKWR